MTTTSLDVAHGYLDAGEIEKALAAFDEIAFLGGDDRIRAQAALEAARICLRRARPHEALSFVESLPATDPVQIETAAVLEVVSRVQLGEFDTAAERLARVDRTVLDGATARAASIAEAHLLITQHRADDAFAVLAPLAHEDPEAPDTWGPLAELIDEGCEVGAVLAAVPEASVLAVYTAVSTFPPTLADRLFEVAWTGRTGDLRVLAAVARISGQLPVDRALTWSLRFRDAGANDQCPLLIGARDVMRNPGERVLMAAAAVESFDDPDARDLVERIAADVPASLLGSLLITFVSQTPSAADSFVVGAATDAARALRLAATLTTLELWAEAAAVARHGLSDPSAATLSAEEAVDAIGADAGAGLAAWVREDGDDELASVLMRIGS